MTLEPAVALGILVVFFFGAWLVYLFVEWIARIKNKNNIPQLYRWRRTREDRKKEKIIELLAIAGGIVAVLIVLYLIGSGPRERATVVYIVLTVVGFIAGIATFFIFAPKTNHSTTKQWKAGEKHAEPTQKYPPSADRSDEDSDPNVSRNEQKAVNLPSNPQRGDYNVRISEIQRKKSENRAILIDLIHLLRSRWQRSKDKSLARLLHRWFINNDIVFVEAFRIILPVGAKSRNIIEGVIQINRISYLVDVLWYEEISVTEIETFLGRLFNSPCQRGILISTVALSPPVRAMLEDVLAHKLLILCELAEIIGLLEQNGDGKDWLLAKIMAAEKDQNPFYKS